MDMSVLEALDEVERETAALSLTAPATSQSSPPAKQEQFLWVIDVLKWDPPPDVWESALALAQPEEQTRIKRFHFPIDAKRSLVGRLMMRHLINKHTGMPFDQIKMLRTKSNKPFWGNPGDSTLSFNVSHHASYVILAGHARRSIGCDVMNFEIPGSVPLSASTPIPHPRHPTPTTLTPIAHPTSLNPLNSTLLCPAPF
jgi:hypothetical protein